ncbi:MAG: hypothetical protein L6R35_001935 [Caloplaca aegaea]|nr:MAG: hypothetical protein L6R35_001935 [Caloplaca aegaea]
MGKSWTSPIRNWWHSPPAYLGIRSSKWTIGITAFGACFTDGFLYGSGLSASVIYTAGLALIADAVDPDEIGAWMGFVFSGNTLGLLFSPFLAGIVYDNLGYYAVFIILFGVIAFDIVLRGFMIEKRAADKWLAKENKPHDFPPEEGNQVQDDGRSNEDTTPPEDEDATLQSTPPNERSSLLQSKSKPSRSWIGRMFPTISVLASSPRLLIATYGCFTHTMLLACIDSILPLFVKRTFEWTSTGAGVIFLTITCPSLFGTFFGIGLNLILPALLADLFYEVEILAETNSDTFGAGGAYAQAYSLLCAALGAAAGVYRYTGGGKHGEKQRRMEDRENTA